MEKNEFFVDCCNLEKIWVFVGLETARMILGDYKKG